MFTKTGSNGSMAKFQKIIIIAMVLVMLFAALPIHKASAASPLFYPSVLRCGKGSYSFYTNIYGAYNGQWIAVRLRTWAKTGNSAWTYGATNWQTMQVNTIGSSSTTKTAVILAFPSGTTISQITDVMFYDNVYGWGQVYSKTNDHFPYLGASTTWPLTSCTIF